jgi:flagellar hook protein FlgE
MFPAFSTALSALQADSTAIDVVGNDLANLNTTGYKATSAQFEDLMSQSMGVAQSGAQVGMGVGQVGTATEYTQGTLTATGGATDAGIQGNGFFVVQNSANQTLYTRDGSFQVNGSGTLTTATGENVQGWPAVNGVVNPNGPTSNLTLPLGTLIPATQTTSMGLTVNLNSTTASGASFSAPVQVYDSEGTKHTITVDFTNTGANSWSYSVSVPPADLSSGSTTPLATGTLSFDSNGNLTSPLPAASPVAISIPGLADGAADMNVNWNLYNAAGTSSPLTQYNQASGVGGTTQDGFGAGQITSVALQNGGLMVATYSNGQQSTVGQVALASIPNPQSLTSVGDNNLQASVNTGAISTGAAGSGGLGTIVAGSLESSTVDIASEFTHMLSYENSYQAASRVITTADQLLQDTINLVHS